MSIMLENEKKEKKIHNLIWNLLYFQVSCIYPAIEKQVVKPTNMEI